MDAYNADVVPDPEQWLALSVEERRRLVLRHHRGRVERTLHREGYRRELHAKLHQLVEDQIARREPAVTGETVARLQAEGLRRHAALHAVIEVLVRGLAAGTDGIAFGAALQALKAGDWLGEQMRRDLGAPE
ncbi:MAG: hypothetical protein R3F59_14590 [Myxococcota bacterium]